MADSDKNILITPNRGQANEPKIEFVGSSSLPITLKVLDDNSLSWEGSEGQLFSITNNLSTGTIFSVNDISGVPSIEVNADGTVILAEFSGNVGVGTASPTKKFEVSGSDILVNGITFGLGGGSQVTNVAIGSDALSDNTTGTSNTAVGASALSLNTTGQWNVAVGNGALQDQTSATKNTGIGFAVGENVTGGENTFVGYTAGYGSTASGGSGTRNTAIGGESLYSFTTGNYNTAVGFASLKISTSGQHNTAIGYLTSYNLTTAAYTVGIGNSALTNNNANYAVAVGPHALQNNTSGAGAVAVGFEALKNNTTAAYNVAVGYRASFSSTTANALTAVGHQALYYNTGNQNTAVGFMAGFYGTSISSNTFVGYYAGRGVDTNNPGTGDNNTGIGRASLFQYTSGANNTAVGSNSMQLTRTGNNNVGVGASALYDNVSGSSNVAVGYRSQWINEGNNYNTSVGDNTLQALNGQYANYNTAVGYRAGYLLTTGYGNTFIGDGSGDNVTTGVYNTILGSYGGTSTQSQQTILSDGTGAIRLWIDNSSRVAVNHSTPWAYLDVRNVSSTYPALLVGNGDNNSGTYNRPQISFSYNGTDGYRHFIRSRHNSSNSQNALDFYVSDGTQYPSVSSGVVHCLSMVSGKVGIGGTTAPSDTLDVNGSITCTSLTETSSRTLKTNIQTLPSQLEKIKKINPVSYTRKETNKEEVGLIAEEVSEIYPEFATDKKINYSKMVAVLFSAVQELTSKVEQQQEEIKQLKGL